VMARIANGKVRIAIRRTMWRAAAAVDRQQRVADQPLTMPSSSGTDGQVVGAEVVARLHGAERAPVVA
jgi:hypothetical protein